jgi:GNAT superfamily N-acetyltransferase
MMDYVVRPAIDADRFAIIALILELNRFEATIEANRDVNLEAAVAGYEATLSTAPQNRALFVAEQEGLLVGYISVAINRAPYYVKKDEPHHVQIIDLVVTKRARGRGIGRALIAQAEAFARQQGIPTVIINALAANKDADELYDALGFEPYMIERRKRLD